MLGGNALRGCASAEAWGIRSAQRVVRAVIDFERELGVRGTMRAFKVMARVFQLMGEVESSS